MDIVPVGVGRMMSGGGDIKWGSYFFWSWQMPPAILEESWIQLWTLSSYSDGNEKLSFGGADSAGPVKKGDSSQLW